MLSCWLVTLKFCAIVVLNKARYSAVFTSVSIDLLSKFMVGNLLGKGAYAEVKLVINIYTNEKFAMKIYDKKKLI